MKQVKIIQLITMALAIWLVSGCRKETASTHENITGDDIASSTEKIASTKSSICSSCATGTNDYDLVDKLKSIKLKEGDNVVSNLANGTKAIAQVNNGIIKQWVLQDTTGIQYLPQSMVSLPTQPGGPFKFYRICFYLDGVYTCWRIIKAI
ncbi:MAG: hypothetical protein ABI707_11885 [Ferruginibacter sp.]